jgi:uncharacterized OsmC-like protein
MAQPMPPTIVDASTSGTFGRCSIEVGGKEFFVDHTPAQEGPGEFANTIDHFLAGVASCGVLMLEMQAKQREIPLQKLDVHIEGDRGLPGARDEDHTLFDAVRMRFDFVGPTEDQANVLVEHYKRH